MNTRLKHLLCIYCIFFTAVMLGQTQNPYWMVPSDSGLYFKMQGGVLKKSIPQWSWYVWLNPGSGSPQTPNYASNTITDASGHPLFYLSDGNVLDSAGNWLDALNWTKHKATQCSFTTYCPPFYNGSTATGYSLNSGGYFDYIAGYTEACVVRNPQNCQQFYIFTTGSCLNANNYAYNNSCGAGGIYDFTQYQSFPFYAVMDLSQVDPYTHIPGKLLTFPEQDDYLTGYVNNGCSPPIYTSFSSTTIYNNTKELFTTIYDKTQPCRAQAIYYAATDIIGSGGTAYNLVFLCDGDSLYAMKLTGTGSTPITVVSKHALPYGSYNSGFRAEMEVVKLSSGNYRVAAPYFGTSGYGIHIVDYTSAGAVVSGTNADIILGNATPSPVIHGLEFNADGSKIYFTHETNTSYPDKVNYKSLPFTGSTTTVSSLTGVPSITDLSLSHIELNYQSSTPYLYFADSTNIVSFDMSSTWNTSAASFGTSKNRKSDPFYYYGNSSSNAMKTYLLPDQIDGGAYPGSSGFDATCCMFYNTYDKMAYNATTAYTGSANQVWKGTHNPLNGSTGSTATIGQELRIPAGYTVTIQNMTLKFSPQASLIVEGGTGTTHGGLLVLKKCTLDVDVRCLSKMWPGVRIWGDATSARSNVVQGSCLVDSSSVITNAWLGVEVGYNGWDNVYTSPLTAPVPSNPTSCGCGDVFINNSSFINNQRDVVLDSCSQTASGFYLLGGQNSTFTTNNYLMGGGASYKPRSHVALYANKNQQAVFAGCAFSCSSSLTSFSGYAYADTAFYSFDSDFNITNGTNRSTFNNFLYGVFAKCSNSTATGVVDHSTLINNKVSIYLGHVNNATITNDTVKIYNLATGNCSGLYLDNCTGYLVEYNNFTKGTGSTANNRYGIVVYNSGSYVNCIFHNSFDNLYKGSQAQYRNYISTFTPGLHRNEGGGLIYLCNAFTSPITNGDIYVPGTGQSANVGATYTGTDTAGICYSQGVGGSYPQTGGNQFSHSTGSSAYDFYIDTISNKGWTSSYVYCSSCGSSYNPSKRKNLLVSSIGSNIDCNDDPYANHGLRVSDPVVQLLSTADKYKDRYDSLKLIIDALPDDSPDRAEIGRLMTAAFNNRHLAINQAVHVLLKNRDDSTDIKVHNLMRLSALELPARSRLETGFVIQDSLLSAQALAEVRSSEGENSYVKLYTVLVNNFSKTPKQIMSDPANVILMQTLDKDSTDKHAYLMANIYLSSVGLSNYKPYYQDGIPESDSSSSVSRKQAIIQDMISSNGLYSKPNPFKDNTNIRATVNTKTDNAYVIITDMLGKEVGKYKLQQGENDINFSATDGSQQVFFCSLVIDGIKVKTNKIVMIRE